MSGTHSVVVDDFGAADDLLTVLLLLSIRWLDIVSEASFHPGSPWEYCTASSFQ